MNYFLVCDSLRSSQLGDDTALQGLEGMRER